MDKHGSRALLTLSEAPAPRPTRWIKTETAEELSVVHCLTVPLLEIQRGAGRRNRVGPRSRSIISIVTGLRFVSSGIVQRVVNCDGLVGDGFLKSVKC